MKQMTPIQHARTQFFGFLLCAVAPFACRGHDEHVHMRITLSAFYSSSGAQAFLMDTLGSDDVGPIPCATLTAHPAPYSAGISLSPEVWLEKGSYFEDMLPYPLPLKPDGVVRGCDHFYTVQPQRIPGEVLGLTDHSEPWVVGSLFLPSGIVNSFVWGSQQGVEGPTFHVFGVPIYAGPNIDTCPDARDHQYSALVSFTKASRDESLALMLYSLGHVLHLNQALICQTIWTPQ
jgi:hypothetical protein